MPLITIGSGSNLIIKIPSKGSVNWAADFQTEFAGKIAAHDHTGNGKGELIGTAAIKDNAVTESKIASDAIKIRHLHPEITLGILPNVDTIVDDNSFVSGLQAPYLGFNKSNLLWEPQDLNLINYDKITNQQEYDTYITALNAYINSNGQLAYPFKENLIIDAGLSDASWVVDELFFQQIHNTNITIYAPQKKLILRGWLYNCNITVYNTGLHLNQVENCRIHCVDDDYTTFEGATYYPLTFQVPDIPLNNIGHDVYLKDIKISTPGTLHFDYRDTSLVIPGNWSVNNLFVDTVNVKIQDPLSTSPYIVDSTFFVKDNIITDTNETETYRVTFDNCNIFASNGNNINCITSTGVFRKSVQKLYLGGLCKADTQNTPVSFTGQSVKGNVIKSVGDSLMIQTSGVPQPFSANNFYSFGASISPESIDTMYRIDFSIKFTTSTTTPSIECYALSVTDINFGVSTLNTYQTYFPAIQNVSNPYEFIIAGTFNSCTGPTFGHNFPTSPTVNCSDSGVILEWTYVITEI